LLLTSRLVHSSDPPFPTSTSFPLTLIPPTGQEKNHAVLPEMQRPHSLRRSRLRLPPVHHLWRGIELACRLPQRPVRRDGRVQVPIPLPPHGPAQRGRGPGHPPPPIPATLGTPQPPPA